jgi:phosphoribosyl 1,2-cyclic phosphodiesterase
MHVHFWGTRGSLPAEVSAEAVRRKIAGALKKAKKVVFERDEEIEAFMDRELPFSLRGTYGSNTACIEIGGGEEYVLCDAGSGLRDFGNHLLNSEKGNKKPHVFNIFLSHLHWDHIQGFPFFTPAYIPGNRVNIYGMHQDMENVFTAQQEPPCFPVPLSYMKAEIHFGLLVPGQEYEVGGFTVKGWKQNHPGDSFGYAFEREGKRIIYCTDSEHTGEVNKDGDPLLTQFDKADLLIFDAQYALSEALFIKENWGHSSNIVAVELSVKAGVKHLCLFHNEPTSSDERLDEFLEDTRRYLEIYASSSTLRIDLAYDGLLIEV